MLIGSLPVRTKPTKTMWPHITSFKADDKSGVPKIFIWTQRMGPGRAQRLELLNTKVEALTLREAATFVLCSPRPALAKLLVKLSM